MEMQVRTFGDILRRLMESKNISIDRLCRGMNIKNKTSVSRILNDETSVNNIINFYNSLIQANPLNLVEYERSQLLESIEVKKVGKEDYIANKIMLSFVTKQKHIEEIVCHKNYSNLELNISNLSELFTLYDEFDDVRICVVNTMIESVVQVIVDCLNKNENFKVEHFVPYEEKKVKNAQNFILTLSLLNFKQYNCYQAYFSQHNRFEFVNRFNNIIIVMKHKNKEYLTDIISIKQEKEFTLLYDQHDKNLFDFYTEIFDDMLKQHNPMKKNICKENSFDNIIHISKELYDLEKPCGHILIKPDFGVNSISPSILHKIAYTEKISSKDIETFLNIHDARYKEYCKRGKSYIGIYSKQGVIDFLDKGYLCDHLPITRPFTNQEAKSIISSIIEISEQNPCNSIYFLKNDIKYNQYQYLLLGQDILYFCDEKGGYLNKNFGCIINSSQIVNTFYNFIKNELIPKHCYSYKESLDFLKSLI